MEQTGVADSEDIQLGSQIELTGFRKLQQGSMPIIRKIVGHGVKIISEKAPKFGSIKITLKKVHEKKEGHGQCELHAQCLVNGKQFTSEVTHRNLFFGLSDILKNIENQIV